MKSTLKTGVAYFHNRDPRHFERDLEDIAAHGCNYIVHCFSELDMAWYNQAVEKIIRMTKDRGIEVYLDPWGVGGMFGGETFSKFVGDHLDVRQIARDGTSLPAACPNQPAFKEFVELWIQRAAELGADVVLWDEPHFYYDFVHTASWDNWACRCAACRELFKKDHGFEMPERLTPEVERFRQRCMLGFLRHNCAGAKRLGMKNSVCLLPDETGSLAKVAGTSPWHEVARIPDVDIFGTDPYWALFGGEVDEFVGRYCDRVRDLCAEHNKEAQIWILAFLITEGREPEVGRAVEIACNHGIRNIAAWAYRGNHTIDIKCSDPDKVWEILGNAFKKAHAAFGVG